MSDPAALMAAFSAADVRELMINDDGVVYVETGDSRLQRLPGTCSEQAAAAFLRALTGEEGFGPQRPRADLSAADGSRVHVLAAPVARRLCVTVRKRPATRPALARLVESGTLSSECAAFLQFAVAQRKNVVVAGGTSSGKTTFLNALAAGIPPAERILVLEDMPELQLPQPHVVYLRTRLPDVTLRDLVADTLRMRPDRVIVGECRGPEAIDLLQAMNVGQEGVLSTLHASSPREALQRLETLVMMGGFDAPLRAVRSYIATAVDLIVFLARMVDGSRRVLQVSEVTGIEVETITMADIFRVESRKDGGQAACLRPTGAIPRFYDGLRQRGEDAPLQFFRQGV